MFVRCKPFTKEASLTRWPELRYRLPRRNNRGDAEQCGRAYAAPPLALNWSFHDQFTAVSRGYFLERVSTDNHARVIPIKKSFDTDTAVMAHVSALAFNRDSFAQKTIDFIEQQDTYGWTGVWEPRIETYNPQLRWYKQAKAKKAAPYLKRTLKQRAVNTSKPKALT